MSRLKKEKFKNHIHSQIMNFTLFAVILMTLGLNYMIVLRLFSLWLRQLRTQA